MNQVSRSQLFANSDEKM
ncbi:hypothetical protein Tsp_10116, partial [Trichinella spiralis]